MDRLFDALGHPLRLKVVRLLLGIDGNEPSCLSQHEMRSLLGIADSKRGTLSKEVASLVSAKVLIASEGAYEVRRPARVRELLHVAAQLNAELAADAVRLAEERAEAATTDERVLRKSRMARDASIETERAAPHPEASRETRKPAEHNLAGPEG
jgi:Tfp pilus assembly protein FimV